MLQQLTGPVPNMKTPLKIFLGIFIFVAGCFAVTPTMATICTPRSGYSYCRSITVQAAQVPSAQTNFTWLVCANATMGNGSTCPTVTGLNSTGGGAHVKNSN